MSFRPLRLPWPHWRKTAVFASSVVVGSWALTHLLAAGNTAPHLIISDEARKERLVPVNPEAVLQQVSTLPIQEWSYRYDPDRRHIGPMAQDFHRIFPQLGGKEDTSIAVVDALGVLFAAIQALEARTQTYPRPLSNNKRVTEGKELQ